MPGLDGSRCLGPARILWMATMSILDQMVNTLTVRM